MFEFKCPKCEVKIRVPEHSAGKRGACPNCRERIVVPPMPQQRPDSPTAVMVAPASLPAEQSVSARVRDRSRRSRSGRHRMLILFGVAMLVLVAIGAGVCVYFQRRCEHMIASADEHFHRKEYKAANRTYLMALRTLNNLPFSRERRIEVRLKLALLSFVSPTLQTTKQVHIREAFRLNPDLMFADFQSLAREFSVELTAANKLKFRRVELSVMLPILLRKQSPLHHSKIHLRGTKRRTIEITYNHKDLKPKSRDASTEYQTTGSLKGDVIRDQSAMVSDIVSFLRNRDALNEIEAIDIKCNHGVIQSEFGLPFGNSVSTLIYATRTTLTVDADSELQTKRDVTVDIFDELKIGSRMAPW